MTEGTICTQNSNCDSKACYITDQDPSIKKCARIGANVQCSNTNIQVFVSVSGYTCKDISGKTCKSESDSTTCAYGCYQDVLMNKFRCSTAIVLQCPMGQARKYKSAALVPQCLLRENMKCTQSNQCIYECIEQLISHYFLCSNQFSACVSPLKPYLQSYSLVCKLETGRVCVLNSDCASNACYPVVKSSTLLCSPSVITCTAGASQALNSQTQPFCALNAGSECSTEPADEQCFSGVCLQIQFDSNSLKCISMESVPTCSSCDSTQKCVADSNNAGICLSINGQSGCTQNSCANYCLASRDNTQICSVQCASCSSTCYSERTGISPICGKTAGDSCDPDQSGECEFSCILQTESSSYVCSSGVSSCPQNQVEVLTGGQISCQPNDGVVCEDDSKCHSGFCFPVVQTNIKRCSAADIDCSAEIGKIKALDQSNLKICIEKPDKSCQIEGSNVDDCLSGICTQIKDDPSTMQCVPTESIAICKACDTSKSKCVVNSNGVGVCLLINGQTGCTTNSCANLCISSKINIPTCSIKCDISCDQTKCRADLTGNIPTCNSLPGDICSPLNSTCEFQCLKLLLSNSYRCSSQTVVCSSKQLAKVDENGLGSCVPNNGELCNLDQDCHSGICLSVVQTKVKKCSETSINCDSQIGSACLDGTTPVCKKMAGQTCAVEGQNSSCFSGYCAQIQGNQSVLLCISVGSTCDCDQNSKKCVADQNNDGICLQLNGQTGCTSDSCANICISSQLNVPTCSIKCDNQCDQTKCRADITGQRPTCNAEAGSECVQENNICKYQCILNLSSSKYQCSASDPNCDNVQIAVINLSGTVECKPNDGEMCAKNSECKSSYCYPVVQSVISRCSKSQIECGSLSNQIPALNLKFEPICVKETGQECNNDSECFTNACSLTKTGNRLCAVYLLCDNTQISVYVDESSSQCYKKGGQNCNINANDTSCAFGCYQYVPDNSSKCAESYDPFCDSSHVGIIKSADYKMHCYLNPGQQCTAQSPEVCQYSCLNVIGSDQMTCSASIPVCETPKSPFIQNSSIVCLLNNDTKCENDSQCASNVCYPVIYSTDYKCAAQIINCAQP
ncbi:Hypothetical_protein [Hexamita inflata]|uniref:Hypothetical_protein n=1 Tax=Hexamita inflata TaxID=28002 RepID=A0AA86UDY9_9EUKA|nr:Hypothetical protein HINF_LOCUS25383 [Hexamita inflata]